VVNKFLFLFGIMLFLGTLKNHAQGGDLLIQQYSRGPNLDASFSKWSVAAGPQINRINSDLGNTSPTISFGGIIQLEYRFHKTVGLIFGINYTPVGYKYSLTESKSEDHLNYLSFPIFLRVHPTKKIHISLGGNYNYYLNGYQKFPFSDFEKRTFYSKKIFKNSFGITIQGGYCFYKKFIVYTNYRWTKRNSPAIQKQSNNTSGIQLGITYKLWYSRKKL